jgi:hypothetical protein
MQEGESAKLHVLDVLWGNISCQQIISMPKMIDCGLIWVETLLPRWCVLGELLQTISANSLN